MKMEACTLLAIATVMAEHADHATGRHVAVTRATIADRVGCDVRTVTAAWRLFRTAGWAVEAQRGHGSPGTPWIGRRPSVYHLVPRKAAPPVHRFHLPHSRRELRVTHVGKDSPSAPQRAAKVSTSSKTRQPRRGAARPLPVQRLAAELVARSHGLDRGHIGAVCDAITAAGINPEIWSARSITDALNADMRARGWSWPDRVERPGAFLAHRLRRLPWRPEGPPKSGGVAATSLEESPRAVAVERAPLTDAQRERIAAARREIRTALAARRGGPDRGRQVDDRRRSGAAFGTSSPHAGSGKTQLLEAGRGEKAAGSDGPVFGRVGAEFGVSFSSQLRCSVTVTGESFECGSGFGA